MRYSALTSKQKRFVERDVESLFSPTAFIPKPTHEDIKRLGLFHPTAKYNRGTLFFSDPGVGFFAHRREKVQFKILMPFSLWFTDSCQAPSVHALRVRMDRQPERSCCKSLKFCDSGPEAGFEPVLPSQNIGAKRFLFATCFAAVTLE